MIYDFILKKVVNQSGQLPQVSESSMQATLYTDDAGDLVLRATLNIGEAPLSEQQLKILGFTEQDLISDVEFYIDEDMTVTGLKDWEATRDNTIDLITRMFHSMVSNNLTTEDVAAKSIEAFGSIYATEQSVLTLYSKRIVPYLFGHGWTLPEGEVIKQEVFLPNPFGGRPLPAIATTTIDDDNKTQELIEYEYVQDLDPDGVREIFTETFERTGLSNDQIEEHIASFSVRDTMRWAYNPDEQVITTCDFNRVASSPGQPTRTERWYWELVGFTDVEQPQEND
ncbi:MAG: hypothetical protein Phyf2KO_16600 [Phycisphaerales bacterium]